MCQGLTKSQDPCEQFQVEWAKLVPSTLEPPPPRLDLFPQWESWESLGRPQSSHEGAGLLMWWVGCSYLPTSKPRFRNCVNISFAQWIFKKKIYYFFRSLLTQAWFVSCISIWSCTAFQICFCPSCTYNAIHLSTVFRAPIFIKGEPVYFLVWAHY